MLCRITSRISTDLEQLTRILNSVMSGIRIYVIILYSLTWPESHSFVSESGLGANKELKVLGPTGCQSQTSLCN